MTILIRYLEAVGEGGKEEEEEELVEAQQEVKVVDLYRGGVVLMGWKRGESEPRF